MIIYVDIDETICITNSDRDYTVSKPIQKNIDIVNALHEKGHRIVYWTSRGTGTGAGGQLRFWSSPAGGSGCSCPCGPACAN